ncbi:carboxypeptidase-like regulatory domain-containing protein [Hymenobacter psoromatis]|uniref:carboxypeptidase-like regulatory domain-containing protein n=1 Tax=Hymenobacter psoromatis TaxID=1484116 RepID=UPI001CBE8212|nr:carboxypeptidase-like regulatory domain-containing protein [Hymenobacter psoromatis]
MKLLYLRQAFVLVTLLLMAHLGWSQGATTAAMSGTITDSKGQALPGATVIAVHTPTNTQYVAPTNSDGRFSIQNMRVGGPYTVKVTFVGFQDFNRTGVNLTLSENFRLDVKLSDASTQLSEVTVTGRQNPVINADRTGAATTIQRQVIEQLPTINRSFADYTRLTPQASGSGGFGGRDGRLNNVTIDGALFNNAFGLAGTIGGQANAQPISLDAIDQIQVSIAPYDVRQGSFTGANVNAVTRSGTNKVSASVYGFYRDQKYVGKQIADVNNPVPTFNLKNFGFRVGGPIIKDKLFFFLNAERELRTDPPTGNYTASGPGNPANGQTVSQASAQDLTTLNSFLMSNYNYSPGAYQGYSLASNSDKITAKIDWNISSNHRFNIKYNYLKSYRDVPPSGSGSISNRSQTIYGLPYFGSYYRINNNLNSFIAELNSTFGAKFSNNMTAGYLANRDTREAGGGGAIPLFPLVDIGNASGLSAPGTRVTAPQTLTSFGYEPFSAFNILKTDTYQFGDNFTAFLGEHNVTVGTYNELYKFTNGFAPQYYGAFVYNSLQDFYASAATTAAPYGYDYTSGGQPTPRTQTEGLNSAQRYQLRYSALADGSFPFAVTNAAQIGLYVQDEWSPASNFKLTYGIRGDLPIIYSTIQQNTALANLTNFRDGIRLNTSQEPKRTVLFSPRVGFNWDVNNDRKTQLRGGTGIFTGRVPYVYLSNQASNNGVQFGSIDVQGTAAAPYTFSGDVNKYRTQLAAGGANTSYNIAVTGRDFKFPQVWRSNLAVDHELPGGIVATLEALYSKDVNAVYFQNVDLPNSTQRAAGPDNRPIFYTANGTGGVNASPYYRIYGQTPDGKATAATVTNPAITDAILLTNTNKGYSYSFTAQLQKTFNNGFYAMAAYTYSDARSVNDGGTIAQSSWSGRPVSGDPNANVLSYSSYLVSNRVIGSVSYRFNYIGHLGTTLSMFYNGQPNGRYSYTYGGDMNGDGVTGNDLMYIPKTTGPDQIQLVDRVFFNNTANKFIYTAAQQAADLEKYIQADPYLRAHRGQYAERNGAQLPWQHEVDVRVLQDIFTNIGENRNALQFSIDIFNVGNLINRNWGAGQFQYTSQPLAFAGYNAQGAPTFQFQYVGNPTVGANGVTSPQLLTTPFRADVTTLTSRWQAQIGLRYLFN